MRYEQRTYINNVEEYESKVLTADEMVRRLAQIMFLRQSGEDIRLTTETDENFEVTKYIMIRNYSDKEVIHHYIVR